MTCYAYSCTQYGLHTHTQYVLPTQVDDWLCLQLHTVGSPYTVHASSPYFAYGLLQTYSLAKQVVMTDKSLRCFSISFKTYEIRRYLINYEAINMTYFECPFSCPSSPARKSRMRRIILLYVSCPAIPYFPTLSHKRHRFRKKILTIKCFIFLCNYVRNISHSKKN